MKHKYLSLAYKEALKAYDLGECPIGAVIVYDGKVIAKAHNLREQNEDPLGHAEILAIKKASKKLGVWRLDNAQMYVTLEPCLMCAGAIINSRIKTVYFGAEDKRNGAVKNNLATFTTFTHKPNYYYLKDESCSQILSNFFKDLRYTLDISKIYLETKRLILRPFSMDDLFDLYEYAKVDGVGEKAGWSHHTSIDISRSVLNKFLEEKETLAIVYKENNKVIGSLGIHKRYYHEFAGLKYKEIGYVLSKDYWRQGIMSEALNTMIPFLFNEAKLDVLICGHFKDNLASQKVILKQGFKEFKRKKVLDSNKIKQDAIYYFLTK